MNNKINSSKYSYVNKRGINSIIIIVIIITIIYSFQFLENLNYFINCKCDENMKICMFDIIVQIVQSYIKDPHHIMCVAEKCGRNSTFCVDLMHMSVPQTIESNYITCIKGNSVNPLKSKKMKNSRCAVTHKPNLVHPQIR